MKVPAADLICFSHLRWNFVFQRPQHLMTRFAATRRVFFIEEPIFVEGDGPPSLELTSFDRGVHVLTPKLARAHHEDSGDARAAQKALLAAYVARERIEAPLAWFYTPMAFELLGDLQPAYVVYDCMDELSGFLGAPPALRIRERELFERADIVFTGGQSLYEAKRRHHPNVHAFPSSVDAEHFRSARASGAEVGSRSPRIGFFGVLDERLDCALLDELARIRPDLRLELVGPVVKIDPAILPRHPNLHYLGPRRYAELPSIIADWDVAIMPFARNDATRFISPTKTLEYMAAGKPIVSTSIRDVVRPYGEEGLVRIADDAVSFGAAIDEALRENEAARLSSFDRFLAGTSWDRSWQQMHSLIEAGLTSRATKGGLAAKSA